MKFNKPFLHSLVVASLVASFSTGCDDDTNDTTDTTPSTETPDTNEVNITSSAKTVETLSGAISSNKTLSSDKVYKISGLVTVKNGATLTIKAGTTLYGTSDGYMVVAKGSKIMAEGTAESPIIFTSEASFNGDKPAQGQWGGLTILGNAPTNLTDAYYEVDSSNEDFAFGGDVSNDNSGVLKYVEIYNSGFAVAQDKEVNGLSLAGVGSGTTVENIYVENSKDDGVELWGGTVNLTDIKVKNAGDDSFDIDSGYSGTVTNLHIEQVSSAHAGIEASSGDDAPMTTATFENLYIKTVAGCDEGAIYIKDDTTAPTFNNVVINHNDDTHGIVRVRSALTTDAKNTISFTNVRSIGSVHSVTGDGADDVSSLLTGAENPYTVETLEGAIDADATLSADKVYKISGLVTVKNGATLTIEAGTTLYGTSDGYMVVAKGSKIIAEGTEDEPIIFTSQASYNGDEPAQGQWGGLTILGNAPTNLTDAYYEVDSSNEDFAFGGDVSNDNSGVLKYVEIYNSGFAVAQDKEVNGLSLAGVGSGTTVENIYIENSKDDGVELWGGTVNLTNIKVKNAGDDSFDIDSGYSGTVTNLHIEQVSSAHAGIEASSGGDAPMTSATFENLYIKTVAHSDEGGIYIKDDTTAPTFNNVEVNHNGTQGVVFVRSNLSTDAKSQISFTNFESTGSVNTINGDGSDDITID